MNDKKPSDRIFIEKKLMPFYQEINAHATKNSNPINQPFIEAKDVFMLAVGLGVKVGKRRPLSGPKEGLFFWNRLSKDLELPSLQLIALCETRNVETMLDDSTIQIIAEEYANEGIRLLLDAIKNKDGNALWNLVDLVRS